MSTGARRRVPSPAAGRLRPLPFAVLAWLLAAGIALADDPAKEFWPEVDTWWRVSPAWRLSLFVPISENLDTQYREGNLIPQVDVAFGTAHRERRLLDEDRARAMTMFLFRGGYLGGKSLDDQGEAYTEHTPFAELHWRLPIKGGFLLSQRLRTEFRWLGQDNPEFSSRLRYRLMLEKEYTVGRVSLVPYVNVEPYYDSRYDTVNRIRLIPGASVSWTRYAAIEGNLTYQHDTRSSTTHTVALNVILHVFLDTSRTP